MCQAAAVSDPTTVNKFQVGYNECANEVSRYLGSVDGLDVELRARLLNHLANCIQQSSTSVPESPLPQNAPSSSGAAFSYGGKQIPSQSHGPFPVAIAPKVASLPVEINNNTIQLPVTVPVQPLHQAYPNQVNILGGVQILPSKLVGGDITFLVPGSIVGGDPIGNYFIPVSSAGAPLSLTTRDADKSQRSSVIVTPTTPSATVTQSSEEPDAKHLSVKSESLLSPGHSVEYSSPRKLDFQDGESSTSANQLPLPSATQPTLPRPRSADLSRHSAIQPHEEAGQNNPAMPHEHGGAGQELGLQGMGPMWRPW